MVVLQLSNEQFEALIKALGDNLLITSILDEFSDADGNVVYEEEVITSPLRITHYGKCPRCSESFMSNTRYVVCSTCRTVVILTSE